jgi:hypothetical protein
VVGGIFGGLTFAAVSRQKSDCGSTCASSALRAADQLDHASAVSDATTSTVAFIAGGALLVTGTVLFLTAPSTREGSPPRASARRSAVLWAVAPTFSRDGAGVSAVLELP